MKLFVYLLGALCCIGVSEAAQMGSNLDMTNHYIYSVTDNSRNNSVPTKGYTDTALNGKVFSATGANLQTQINNRAYSATINNYVHSSTGVSLQTQINDRRYSSSRNTDTDLTLGGGDDYYTVIQQTEREYGAPDEVRYYVLSKNASSVAQTFNIPYRSYLYDEYAIDISVWKSGNAAGTVRFRLLRTSNGVPNSSVVDTSLMSVQNLWGGDFYPDFPNRSNIIFSARTSYAIEIDPSLLTSGNIKVEKKFRTNDSYTGGAAFHKYNGTWYQDGNTDLGFYMNFYSLKDTFISSGRVKNNLYLDKGVNLNYGNFGEVINNALASQRWVKNYVNDMIYSVLAGSNIPSVSYRFKNPVFKRMTSDEGKWNPLGQIADPSYVESGNQVWMWYGAQNGQDVGEPHIKLAKTYEGTTFSDLVLSYEGGNTWYRGGTVIANLIIPSMHSPCEPNAVWDKNINEFRTWFTAYANSVPYILYAHSADGSTVIQSKTPVVSNASQAFILKDDSITTYYMIVNRNGATQYDILSSPDGNTFSMWHEDALHKGTPGQWDGGSLGNMCGWIENGTWYMLYEAKDSGNYKIGLASAPGGYPWTKEPSNPVINRGGTRGGPFVRKIGSTYYVWMHGNEVNALLPTDIYREESTDRINWSFPEK